MKLDRRGLTPIILTTEDELTSFIESESAKLQKLDTKRTKLRNRIRRASDEEKDSLKEQLKEMNKEIKQQKKTVYYGNDIHERFKEMKDRIERVQEVTEEQSKETENSISFEI